MAALKLLLLLPLASGLMLKNTAKAITSDSNPTFLSTDANWYLPKFVSPEIDSALNKLVTKVRNEDTDTMYFGAYVDEEGHSLHVKTSQTSAAGHKEHMAHTKMNNMQLMSLGAQMVGSTWWKRFLFGEQPITMAGPVSLIDDVREIMAPLGTQYFAHHSGKNHMFTKINPSKPSELSLVMLDPSVKLKSGLTQEVQDLVKEFIKRGEQMDKQAVFDFVFQPETNTLSFREMYADADAAIASKEATQDIWKKLTADMGNPVLKFDAHAPSSEIKKLKDSWKGAKSEGVKFYSLHSGFQMVSLK